MINKEARARIKINKLLEESGWRLIDTEYGKANVLLENNVKITKKGLNELGEDYERVEKGYIDYLLLDERNFPVCVLEAKSEEVNPLVGIEQARKYADSQKARFIILSNGNIHYFWNKEKGNPTRISNFPRLENLKSQSTLKPDTTRLVNEKVGKDFITLTKHPYYSKEPLYVKESTRDRYIDSHKLNFLREYQIEAIQSLQKAVSEGKNRFLFEMATGTGKTLISAAVIKLFLKTGNANRVLFLVDRLELEVQAKENFDNYLLPDYSTKVFKENKDDWRSAEILITTIQSISYENKYLKIFSPFDFDLIISDEAHRSISGNSRAIFEYFLGNKLGLTATPKDYLRNLSVEETDPREVERRVLLSTYKTFGCESGNPTFRYTLKRGVQEEFLVPFKAVDCRTDITTELLSEEGYSIPMDSADEDEQEIVFTERDFEKDFFSNQTNIEFCKTFIENALKDPISGETGKSIIFCVSRRHSRKITAILNNLAEQKYPGYYNSDFAVQVTSDIPGAQDMAKGFSNNNLNGHTKFLEGYKSSKTRVCVTVGMMTTGYDCPDLLNIGLFRPIFSPTDFVQIRGRGTRRFKFKYQKKEGAHREEFEKGKEFFRLFDFFAVCEYFEKKFNYDEVIKLPLKKKKKGEPLPSPAEGSITIDIPDPLATFDELEFKDSVMLIDKKMYSEKFEEKLKETYKKDSKFKSAYEKSDYETMEKIVKERLFDKPEEYYNLEKLRKAYDIDRKLSLWEIIDKIFGRLKKFKTREDIAEEEFDKFKTLTDIPPNLYYEIKEFFKLYVLDEEAREYIDNKDFSLFTADPAKSEMLDIIGKERLSHLPQFIKNYINLNLFD